MKLLSRKFLSLFLAVLTATALVPVTAISAFAASSGDFEYQNYSGYATVTGYNGTATDVTIPATIDGYPVNKIKDRAFWGNESIESITVSGRDLTVGNYAFGNCKKLKDVVLEDGVIKVGDSAFNGCETLESVTLASSVTEIGFFSFSGCKALQSISIPNGVTSIGNGAFSDCSSLLSLTVPSGVAKISDSLASGCTSLKNVTLPATTTAFSSSAFEGCSSLESITVPYGTKFIGSAAFKDCTSLKSITVPESVLEIEDNAFENCTSLNSIALPKDLDTIGISVFKGCTGLKELSLPDSVSELGLFAFSGCSSLESITIPESVQSVPESLCEGCSSLRSVTLKYGVLTINDNAFKNCSSLVSLSLPNSLTDIEYNVFYGCESLCTVTIPESVTWIGNSFEGCVKLVEVINHSSLNIEAGTSYNGKIALNAISVKTDEASSITEKDGFIFFTDGDSRYLMGYNGTDTELALPKDLDSKPYDIYKYAFKNNGKIESVTLSNNTVSVGDGAFENCTSLVKAAIPSSVTAIGSGAFNGCTKVTVYCAPNSFAEKYAKENNIPFTAFCTHNWVCTEKTELTCLTDGHAKYVCSLCDDSYTEDTKAPGHDFDVTFTVDVTPTDSTDGSRSRHCTRCDAVTGTKKMVAYSKSPKGDIDGDGRVAASDLLALKKVLIGVSTDENWLYLGNALLSGGSVPTNKDLLLLKKALLGIEVLG